MQFEVSKPVLLKAIASVNGAVEKKNTIPVLQNIKIEVVKNTGNYLRELSSVYDFTYNVDTFEIQ